MLKTYKCYLCQSMIKLAYTYTLASVLYMVTIIKAVSSPKAATKE